jgi:hypothetical protein
VKPQAYPNADRMWGRERLLQISPERMKDPIEQQSHWIAARHLRSGLLSSKNATKRRPKVQASTRIETASLKAVVTISICPSDSSGNIGSETNWRAALSATGKVPVS